MFSEYINNPSKIINKSLADQLIYLRNKYDYPKSYLVKSNDPTDIFIDENFWAKPIVCDNGIYSDIELDNYHHRLLHSDVPSENLLGTASVIFWGFQTFSEKLSLIRTMRHIDGYKNKPKSLPSNINSTLHLISKTKNPGTGLGYLSPISQLGQTPFASKVIAFMFPETTGVYDNQIMNGLKRSRSEWAHSAGLVTPVGDVSKPSTQHGYTKWCQFLTEVAGAVNAGIADGNAWHWTDPCGSKNSWRAIDVERALFHYFKNKADL